MAKKKKARAKNAVPLRQERDPHAASSVPGRTRSRVIARTSRQGQRQTGQRH